VSTPTASVRFDAARTTCAARIAAALRFPTPARRGQAGYAGEVEQPQHEAIGFLDSGVRSGAHPTP
jgi:hypothetical protein